MNSTTQIIVWMVGAILSFTLMGISGRELSAELDTWGILFLRSIVGLVVVFFLLQFYGWQLVRTQRLPMHLLRNIIHYGGQYGWFFGISLLPLAQVFAIEFTVPIWALLLAVFFLGEKLTSVRIFALLMGLAGVLVILRPGIIAINSTVLIVVASAVCYAIAHTATKSLVKQDSPLTILFYMTLIQLPIGALLSWQTFSVPSAALWPWVIIVGLTALSAHYCLARALTIGDAAIVLPIDFLRLPTIAVAAALLYAESVDIWLFVGGALMVIGNLTSLKAEQKSSCR